MLLKEIIKNLKRPLTFNKELCIDKKEILKILEAARWAPSAENQQVWRFIIIDDIHGKKIAIKSIQEGDPRLRKESKKVSTPNLKAQFVYSSENFDSKTEKYKDNIGKFHSDDVECAQTASLFIICTHKDTRLGRIFGSTDMGASITNIILMSIELGFSVRYIKNFNRETIRKEMEIPEIITIDATLAIGKPVKTLDKPEFERRDLSNYFSHNQWDSRLQLSVLDEDESLFQEYNIEIVDPILDRRSIRSFYEMKALPKKAVLEILNAGMMVPLTIDEPYIKIIIMDDKSVIREFAQNSKFVIQQSHVNQVPLIVAITYDCGNNSPAFYAEMDTGAILQNMILRAHSLGIGSCWIGAFSHRAARRILKIEENWDIPSVAIFGYPKKYPKPTPRLSLGKIGYYNTWEVPIEKKKRSLLPNYHILSIASRKLRNTHVKTRLRKRKVGYPKGIPEFENL